MLKFLNQTEKIAKSKDEAIKSALEELNVTEDEVTIDVIEEGSKGFLGFGSKDAKVVVTVKEPAVRASKAFLNDIFSAMNINAEINAKMNEDRLDIDLSGDDMGIIIGKHGNTLDSLQYLTSLIVNHGCGSDNYIKVTLDTEDYREKRTETLIALSDRLSENVVRTGRKKTLEPMNPNERRVIHSNLQSNEDVVTYSIGDEPYRKVVIAPKNPAKQYYKKPYGRDKYYRKNYNKRPDYTSRMEDYSSYDDENE